MLYSLIEHLMYQSMILQRDGAKREQLRILMSPKQMAEMEKAITDEMGTRPHRDPYLLYGYETSSDVAPPSLRGIEILLTVEHMNPPQVVALAST